MSEEQLVAPAQAGDLNQTGSSPSPRIITIPKEVMAELGDNLMKEAAELAKDLENTRIADEAAKKASAAVAPENAPPESEKSGIQKLMEDYPAFFSGWKQSIVNWIATHGTTPPIFINPITNEPQWMNRAQRRKYERNLKK